MTQPTDISVASYADLQRTCAELLAALKRFVESHEVTMPAHPWTGKHKPCKCGPCAEARELINRCENRA